MKAKIKLLVLRVKSNAVKLRCDYQLPYYLTYLIRNIDDNTDEVIVKRLCTLCEIYIRVKGYYKKYPLHEKEANEQVKKMFVINNGILTEVSVERN